MWHGIYAPADTPDEILQALTDALAAALEDPTVIEEFAKLGTAPVTAEEATPEAHTQLLEEQIDLWQPIIEAAGVTGS